MRRRVLAPRQSAQRRSNADSVTHQADTPLSRAELAELVNAWVFQERGRVIELSGDYTEGARHATAALERLPIECRTKFETGLGEQVLTAIPPQARVRTEAKKLHELISSDLISEGHNAIQS